jgi:pimeloyl-ACP methyl ester carboxylesterase
MTYANGCPELRPPTLFLAAEQDHLVPSVVQAKYMAERVAGSTVRTLSGHGHICLIAPDIDLRRILEEWQGARETGVNGVTAQPVPR